MQGVLTTPKVKALDYKKCRKALLKLRAINHPIRRRMMLYMREKGECTGLEMIMALREVSIRLHLMPLNRENFVKTRRAGKFIFYRVNEREVQRVGDIIRRFNSYNKSYIYG